MSVEKSSNSEKSDQRPTDNKTDNKTDELDEKQLDKAVGGTGGTTTVPHAPIGPGPTG